MALVASFTGLSSEIRGLGEALTGLRVLVCEDAPGGGAVPLLVERLGEAVLDLAGWADEAGEQAERGGHLAERPRDLEAAQVALLACQERALEIARRFTEDVACGERFHQVEALGRERGRAWRFWAASAQESVDQSQQALLSTFQALHTCWREIVEISCGALNHS